MARIVLSAVAAAAAALLLHFHPWAPATQSQETYRAAVEPGVNLPSVPTPSQPAKPVEDPLPPASSLVRPPVVSVSATPPVLVPADKTCAGGLETLGALPPQPGAAAPPQPPPMLPSPVPPPPPILQSPQTPPTLPSPVPPGPPPSFGGAPSPTLQQVPQAPPKLVSPVDPLVGEVRPPNPSALGAPPPPPSVDDKLPPAPPSRDRIRAKAQIPEPPPSAPTPPVIGVGNYQQPSPPLPPIGPAPAPVTAVKPLTSPWSFHLEIVEGKNLITAKVGKTVQFRVVCEKLEIHSPAGNILATGKVKISSQALEANCDVLTIQLQDEAVLLTGAAQMKCQHEGKELDLRADSFSLKLSDIQGTSSKAAPKDVDPLFGVHNTSASQNTEAVRPPIITVTPGPIVK